MNFIMLPCLEFFAIASKSPIRKIFSADMTIMIDFLVPLVHMCVG